MHLADSRQPVENTRSSATGPMLAAGDHRVAAERPTVGCTMLAAAIPEVQRTCPELIHLHW
jgi:hypothetical protein